MPVTLTIKGVPDAVAEGLRQRAAASRRSLQRELLLIIEQAVAQGRARIADPEAPVYVASAEGRTARAGSRKAGTAGRLSLEELWQRARTLGPSHPPESAAIVRADRDARDRR